MTWEATRERIASQSLQRPRDGTLSLSPAAVDVRAHPGQWMTYGHPYDQRKEVWNPKFCMITDGQILLLDKEEVRTVHSLVFPYTVFHLLFLTRPWVANPSMI